MVLSKPSVKAGPSRPDLRLFGKTTKTAWRKVNRSAARPGQQPHPQPIKQFSLTRPDALLRAFRIRFQNPSFADEDALDAGTPSGAPGARGPQASRGLRSAPSAPQGATASPILPAVQSSITLPPRGNLRKKEAIGSVGAGISDSPSSGAIEARSLPRAATHLRSSSMSREAHSSKALGVLS